MDLTLVVLAAGLSTRFGRLKQLEPVGPSGEALLDYGIYDALRAGFSEVVLVIRPDLESAFSEHIERVFGDSLVYSFALQELGSLPGGFSVPDGRAKPWGTGHAVLAAESIVHGPFVVMNADDFYGASAFALLADHLQTVARSDDPDFAAAGYRLRDTLSPSGGVSRAICELDAAGYFRRVTEVKNIAESDGAISGVTIDGKRLELTGDETISMNLWAATPVGFELLSSEFERFLEAHGDDPEAEFLLSMTVNDLIDRAAMRVKVIRAPGPWLGVTFPEDRPVVERRIRELIDEGHYPENLSVFFP